MKIVSYKPMAIALNGTLSAAIDCRSEQLVGLVTDADWTAQNLSLEVSLDNSENSYVPFKALDGTAFSISSAPASCYIPLDIHLTGGLRYVAVKSAVAQAKATTVMAVLRDLS